MVDSETIRNILTLRYDPQYEDNTDESDRMSARFSDPDGRHIEKILLQSAQRMIPDDGRPLAIALSDGVDSTLALWATRKLFPDRKINCFCGVFEGAYDESDAVKLTAARYNADFETIHMEPLFSCIPHMVHMSRGPKWNAYFYQIARHAARHSKYLITGDGGDEFFAGYVFRYSKFMSLRGLDSWTGRTKAYLECHSRDWVPDQEMMFGSSIPFDWNDIYGLLQRHFDNELDPLDQVLCADIDGKLRHDFIPTNRFICSEYGLTGLPIFLDSQISRAGTMLEWKDKYDPQTNMGKIVLRRIARRNGIAHTSAVAKRGFSPNILYEWRFGGRDIITSYLHEKSNVVQKHMINPDWIVSAIKKVDLDGDARYCTKLLSVLGLEVWYRMHVLQDMRCVNL